MTQETNPAETSNEKDHANFLANFIKEDREEIRLIKNRIYTYMQVLIAASLAITSFFIKGSKEGKNITDLNLEVIPTAIGINVLFLIISFVFFYFQYRDLKFVRRCLQKREQDFNIAAGKVYFKIEQEKEGKFRNDRILWVPMAILILIYFVVICWLCSLKMLA